MQHRQPSFRDPTPQEAHQAATRQKETDQTYNDAIKRAQACLDHDLFAVYRDQAELAEKGLFNAALMLELQDPVQYAFRMNNIMERIRAVRSLLNSVELEASRPPKKVKEAE